MRIILIQLLIVLTLITIDLYVFRGFYSSKVYIQYEEWNNDQIYSCELKIEKISNDNYLFTFRNKSILPKYFLNYRNDKIRQKVTDTIFFNYLEKNLFPAYSFDYYRRFDCGTGVGLSSINPLESFRIEKSYEDIINESSSLNRIKNITFFNKRFIDLDYYEIDSLIVNENPLVSINDSIEIEYYINMNSFISKDVNYIVSNRINVSLKDILDQYKKRSLSRKK